MKIIYLVAVTFLGFMTSHVNSAEEENNPGLTLYSSGKPLGKRPVNNDGILDPRQLVQDGGSAMMVPCKARNTHDNLENDPEVKTGKK